MRVTCTPPPLMVTSTSTVVVGEPTVTVRSGIATFDWVTVNW